MFFPLQRRHKEMQEEGVTLLDVAILACVGQLAACQYFILEHSAVRHKLEGGWHAQTHKYSPA